MRSCKNLNAPLVKEGNAVPVIPDRWVSLWVDFMFVLYYNIIRYGIGSMQVVLW
jgi:hypothetical protein